MNESGSPRARTNDDGSVDVWARGRRLHFPGAGGRPTVTEDETPADAGELPAAVRVDDGDVVTMVNHDDWLVRLSADTVDVTRARARLGTLRVFSRRPRGG